jgi:hypothetical protein
MAKPVVLDTTQPTYHHVERGGPGLSPEADWASRVTISHAEGMPLAFANIYADLAEVITAKKQKRSPVLLANYYPNAVDGLRSIAATSAAIQSAKRKGQWHDARPPPLRGVTSR